LCQLTFSAMDKVAGYILERLLLTVPTLLGITVVTFIVLQLAPGGPAEVKLQAALSGQRDARITEEVVEQTRRLYGLDQPLHRRYLQWVSRIVRLDFGHSYKDHRPVIEKIWEALRITLVLNIVALVLSYLLSIPWGVYSSRIAGSRLDQAVTVFLFILYSLPSFWVATMLILFLGGGEFFDVFPTYGFRSYGSEAWPLTRQLWDYTMHLFLPVTCLTYGSLALLSRYARVAMLEVVEQDYVRTARAKGLGEGTVIFKHAFRNALIPLITLFANVFPALIGGSVIVETIFSIPGMGKLGFESVLARDYPVIMAIATISAVLTLLGILIADILYVVVDPRVSFKQGGE